MSCKAEKAQTSSDEATEHIERYLRLKNGSSTPKLLRMYEIGIGFVWSTTDSSVEYGYWKQKGLTSTLTDQGPYEFAVSGAGEDYIDMFSTDREYRCF